MATQALRETHLHSSEDATPPLNNPLQVQTTQKLAAPCTGARVPNPKSRQGRGEGWREQAEVMICEQNWSHKLCWQRFRQNHKPECQKIWIIVVMFKNFGQKNKKHMTEIQLKQIHSVWRQLICVRWSRTVIQCVSSPVQCVAVQCPKVRSPRFTRQRQPASVLILPLS